MPPIFPDLESVTRYRTRNTSVVSAQMDDKSDTNSMLSDYEIFKSRRKNGGQTVMEQESPFRSSTYEDANDTFASRDSPPDSIRSFASEHSATFDYINSFEITNVKMSKIHILANQKKPSLSSKLKSILRISTKDKQYKSQYKPQYAHRGSGHYSPSTMSTVSAPTFDYGSKLSRFSTQHTRVATDSIFGFASPAPSIRSLSTLRHHSTKEKGNKYQVKPLTDDVWKKGT